jgi:ADP-ribosylglycohydrolase
MTRHDHLAGCLLGTAVGDAIGLPFEGLRPARIRKWLRRDLNHRFVLGHGMVSDDTDHTVFVAQALAAHPEDIDAFVRLLAWKFRLWLLCLPAGIGLATLRSIVRLWFGLPPARSGVFSAGNGPTMRSAVIGVCLADNPDQRRHYVQAASQLTHTDPKALFGAIAVAELAAWMTTHDGRPALGTVEQLLRPISEAPHWQAVVTRTLTAVQAGDLNAALTAGADKKGVSGYIYHTLPPAIAAWYLHYGDYRATIDAVVRLGGDTDTTAAIAGALAGTATGPDGIPMAWLSGVIDRPHSIAYITRLCEAVETGIPQTHRFSPWLFPRGILFTGLVLGHGFRRLLPPY